jgi:cob(I)alamin adenosyltransferase
MKIYTKTGDDGSTGLFGGARVPKDHPAVEAYGTVDEVNAFLGVARGAMLDSEVQTLLDKVQGDLFTLGAELATPAEREDRLARRQHCLDASDIEVLEQAIDRFDAALPPLKTFVLPGGSPSAAALHTARAICRRAERRTLMAQRSLPIRQELLVYLNRLSDLLFVLARYTNHAAGIADIPWVPPKS